MSDDSQNVISVCWESMENNLEKGRFLMVLILYLQNGIMPKSKNIMN